MTDQPTRISEKYSTTDSTSKTNDSRDNTPSLSENDPRVKEFRERIKQGSDKNEQETTAGNSQAALSIAEMLKQAMQANEKTDKTSPEKQAKGHEFDLSKLLGAEIAHVKNPKEGQKTNQQDAINFLSLVKSTATKAQSEPNKEALEANLAKNAPTFNEKKEIKPSNLVSTTTSGNTVDGSVILQTLQQSSSTQQVSNVEVQKLSRVNIELIERILVSNAALNNNQEVRVTFNQNVLPGTEVSISRQGNALNVTFVSTVDTSFTFLNTNQAGLRDHLVQRLSLNEVNINVRSSASNDGMPNDGRSRNQREYFDMDSESV